MRRLFNYRTEQHDTSLFPAIRVPRLPATGAEIGECSRFANQGLRRQTKCGPLQSRTTRGDCFFERLPIRGLRAADCRRVPPGALRDRGHRRVFALGHATAWSMLEAVV